MDTTSHGTFASDTASTDELFAAMDRRDAAIAAKFAEHVARVMGAFGLSECFGNPEVRQHYPPGDVDPVASDTRIFWGEQLTPVLVGTVLREVNHTLLTITDRSGAIPVVHEYQFDTRNFI